MIPTLGVVTLETWQAVFLILLCFASLIIALYCLFFMVPLKSFMNRINSLGGGMEGMRSHVQGVRNKVEKQIAELEEEFSEKQKKDHEEIMTQLESLQQTCSSLQKKMKKADRQFKTMQSTVQEEKTRTDKLAQKIDSTQSQLKEAQNELNVFENELNGSLRKMVSQSYMELEATILSALESVQEEILWTCNSNSNGYKNHRNGDRSPGKPTINNLSPSFHKETHKIISTQPLFPDSSSHSDETQPADDSDKEPEIPETP